MARIFFDTPGRAINTFGTPAIAAFEEIVGLLETNPPEAVVVASAKPGAFLAGADLDELAQLVDPAVREEAATWLGRGQAALERFRRLPFPTVAWIDGAAMGGGLEVALACRFRVASDDRRTVLAMPEVQLGLIPALGGSFDVPRAVGLRRGLELLLTGRRLRAAAALAWGLLDEVVPSAVGERAAVAWATEPGHRKARRPIDWLRAPGLRSLILRRARRSAAARTGPSFQVPARLIDCVAAGLAQGRAGAERLERELFAGLAADSASRAMVHLFLRARSAMADDPSFDPSRPLGIVGGGFMGSGIARVALRQGLTVRVHDRRPEALARLVGSLSSRRPSRKGTGTPDAWRLTTSLEPLGYSRCDLVIEAVSEDLAIKHAVLQTIEAEVREVTVLASNTSTIPIAQIARGLRYPNRVIGLHFFSPVERMPLVEIVRHPTAGDPFVARARSFVRSLGKTPIVVRDGPGFFTTRVLAPYLAQGAQLVVEGASIRQVDRAARDFGFPVGPLELLDEVGLDVALAAASTLAAAFPDRMPAPREFRALIENGRLGRKVGRGFYDYRSGRKRADPTVEDLLARDEPRRSPTLAAISERLVWAMVAEAWRTLDEGIVASADDGDLAAVLGLGFPAWRGGPFRFVRDLPAGVAEDRMRRLAEHHGAAFEISVVG